MGPRFKFACHACKSIRENTISNWLCFEKGPCPNLVYPSIPTLTSALLNGMFKSAVYFCRACFANVFTSSLLSRSTCAGTHINSSSILCWMCLECTCNTVNGISWRLELKDIRLFKGETELEQINVFHGLFSSFHCKANRTASISTL